MNFDFSSVDISALASSLAGLVTPEAIKDLAMEGRFIKYKDDPVGFCEDVLDETLTDEVKLLANSVKDNKISIGVSATGTGKSHIAARLAIWFYSCFPGAKVFTSAAPPIDNLRQILWGEIGSVVRGYPQLFKGHEIKSLEMKKGPEEFLVGVTIPSSGTDEERESKFSGKHAPHMLFILDEADAIADCVFRGIDGCMSGGHVRLLCMFNPKRKAGSIYRMIRDKRASVIKLTAFNHPNVITGKDVIPGAVTRDVTVERINEWCKPLKDVGNLSDASMFTLPDFLVGKTCIGGNGKEPWSVPGPGIRSAYLRRVDIISKSEI
jgi:hypothetical protein